MVLLRPLEATEALLNISRPGTAGSATAAINLTGIGNVNAISVVVGGAGGLTTSSPNGTRRALPVAPRLRQPWRWRRAVVALLLACGRWCRQRSSAQPGGDATATAVANCDRQQSRVCFGEPLSAEAAVRMADQAAPQRRMRPASSVSGTCRFQPVRLAASVAIYSTLSPNKRSSGFNGGDGAERI